MDDADSGQSRATLTAPVSPFTWEVQAELPRTVLETGRLPLKWNRPVEIVGMQPSVVALNATGTPLLVPTADDIQVLLDSNQQDRYTNRLEDTAATAMDESYVTLSSMSTFLPRLMRIQLRNASPQIGIGFRWKRHNPIAAPRFFDALIGIAFFCRYID